MNDRPAASQPGDDGDGDDSNLVYERQSTSGMPRWVKVSGILALLLALLVVIVVLVGGGEHGPRRHAPSDGTGDHTPPTRVTEGHQPPAGGHG